MNRIKRVFTPAIMRWMVGIGVITLGLMAVSLWLVRRLPLPVGSSAGQALDQLVIGAVLCLVAGTTGLLIGLNRLWAISLRKTESVSSSRLIIWITILIIGLPWLGSRLPGLSGLFLGGRSELQPGGYSGSAFLWSLPDTYYLLQALILAILVYAILMRPKRIAPDFISSYRGGAWSLIWGALVGAGCWLVGVFIRRLISPAVPAALANLPYFLVPTNWNSATHLNWAQILVLIGLAPLAEELFLRGFVLPRWSQAWGIGKAWVATALLSGLMVFNPAALPVVVIFSLSASWLALRVRNMAPVWVAHLVFNGLFLILMPF